MPPIRAELKYQLALNLIAAGYRTQRRQVCQQANVRDLPGRTACAPSNNYEPLPASPRRLFRASAANEIAPWTAGAGLGYRRRGSTRRVGDDVSRRHGRSRLCYLHYVRASTYGLTQSIRRTADATSWDFLALERDARENGLGLWADVAAPIPASVSSQGSCDPSYPNVCIPSPPPELDCGEITHRRFAVVGSDPHGFDGDGDAVGCER